MTVRSSGAGYGYRGSSAVYLQTTAAGSAQERTVDLIGLDTRFRRLRKGWSSAPELRTGRVDSAGDHGDGLQRKSSPSCKAQCQGCAISSRKRRAYLDYPRGDRWVLKEVDNEHRRPHESRACAV